MSYRSSLRLGYGTGRTGEQVSVWLGPNPAGKVPLILCHGFLAGASQWYDTTGQTFGVARAAAASGIPAFGPDLGLGDAGLNYWGTDDVVAAGGAIDDAVAWAATTWGTRTDKVGLYGTSMGGTALGWCWRNPTKVAAAAFTIPAVSLQGIHDRNPIGLATYIELAYVNLAGLVAAYPTHDPSHPNNTAQLAAIADRIGLWYSSNDNVIAAAEVTAFAAATGITATNVGAFGHSVANDQQPVLDWLLPRLWRA
jgi:hypothetical protein